MSSDTASRLGTRTISDGAADLDFGVATSVDEAILAWKLVYTCYRRVELISPNPYAIHLVPQAIHPTTVVIVGKLRETIVSTMTMYPDRISGLPLDLVYSELLDSMRRDGRKLIEVGLFADRREKIIRSMQALLELMRHVFYFAMHNNLTDIVIGVHPDHQGFYERCFAFKQFGPIDQCPSVMNNPMVPMRLALPETLAEARLPKGLRIYRENPMATDVFQRRAVLTRDALSGTEAEAYAIDLFGEALP